MGKGCAILISMNSFLLLGVLTSVPIFGENRSRNATVRVLVDGQTDRQTDRCKPIL